MVAAAVSFLTPVAALVSLAAGLALLAFVLAERRSRRLARALGLRPRGGLAGLADAVALVLAGCLLAVAVAQPVVSRVQPRDGRMDAEAIFVFDISRSMLAREGRDGTSRFERARRVAKELRATMPSVPAGISSVTDRVLPYLFPTTSANAFTATADRAMGIERPPPDRSGRGQATALEALSSLATQNFFGGRSRHRLAVVLTDGETLPVDVGSLGARLQGQRIVPIFIHVWASEERVYNRSDLPERAYRPDPDSRGVLETLARATRGRVFGEGEVSKAADAARDVLGRGPTGPQGEELQSSELAPHAALAAFVPLLYLLWRRNLAR
jgi:hypothetical protein